MNAHASSAPDPPGPGFLLDELVDLVRRTEHDAEVAQRTASRNERNRVGMLYIHGWFGLAVALLFPLIGQVGMAGPAWTALRRVPGAPYTLAIVLGVGAVLLIGSGGGHRRGPAYTGLALVGVFYTAMAVGFGAALLMWLFRQHPGSLVDLFRLIATETPGKPATYAGPLYAHWAVVMLRHARTLRRLHADEEANDHLRAES